LATGVSKDVKFVVRALLLLLGILVFGRRSLNCKEVASAAVDDTLIICSMLGGRSGEKVGVEVTNMLGLDSREGLAVAYCMRISS
jgi:hypothetical protein